MCFNYRFEEDPDYDYRCKCCGHGYYADVGCWACPHCGRTDGGDPSPTPTKEQEREMELHTEAMMGLMGVHDTDQYEMLTRLVSLGIVKYDNKKEKYYWTTPKKKYFR